MTKEFKFFIYLLEHYADYKRVDAGEILKVLQEKGLLDLVMESYELYHIEAIENAFHDLDHLIETGVSLY